MMDDITLKGFLKTLGVKENNVNEIYGHIIEEAQDNKPKSEYVLLMKERASSWEDLDLIDHSCVVNIENEAKKLAFHQNEKQEIKQDISNFTIMPTLQDDSILMQKNEKIPEPDLLQQQQVEQKLEEVKDAVQEVVTQQKEIVKHSMLGTCWKVTLSIAAIIGMILLALLMMPKAGAQPQKFDNQLAEFNKTLGYNQTVNLPLIDNSTFQNYTTGANQTVNAPLPKVGQVNEALMRDLKKMGSALADVHPEQQSQHVPINTNDPKDQLRKLAMDYNPNQAPDLSKPEKFKEFARETFFFPKAQKEYQGTTELQYSPQDREFYQQHFFLDQQGYPYMTKEGTLLHNGTVKFKDLREHLKHNGISDSNITVVIDNMMDLPAVQDKGFKDLMNPEDYNRFCDQFNLDKKNGYSVGWVVGTMIGIPAAIATVGAGVYQVKKVKRTQ